ncbi:MAG: CapA family protein [Bacteroidota bacterium]|nr:CapA family protein [Bacteroidota bacterium]
MTEAQKKAIRLIIVVTLLIFLEILLRFKLRTQQPKADENGIKASNISQVTFLAFGDINLGRKVGQHILAGEINYPFEKINLHEDSADIIFANLESQISDQNGETVSSKNNLIFTGPPQGAVTLKNSGITIVSTANNHALDYEKKALAQTLEHLDQQGIFHVGTSLQKGKLFDPVIIEKNNIKFAIFSVTSFVNFSPKNWKETIAYVDTGKLLYKMSKAKGEADIIIVSYHGGVEYTDHPRNREKDFAEWCIAHGANIFLGHHPHVTYGIEKKGNGVIVQSLGNFVFFQPQHYWTQRSYGVKFRIEKKDSLVTIGLDCIFPLEVGLQTKRLADSVESRKLLKRTQQLSNFDLTSFWK